MTDDPPIWRDEATSEEAGQAKRESGGEDAEVQQFLEALAVAARDGYLAITATDAGFLMGNPELHKRTGVMVDRNLILQAGTGPCIYAPGGRKGKLWATR